MHEKSVMLHTGNVLVAHHRYERQTWERMVEIWPFIAHDDKVTVLVQVCLGFSNSTIDGQHVCVVVIRTAGLGVLQEVAVDLITKLARD